MQGKKKAKFHHQCSRSGYSTDCTEKWLSDSNLLKQMNVTLIQRHKVQNTTFGKHWWEAFSAGASLCASFVLLLLEAAQILLILDTIRAICARPPQAAPCTGRGEREAPTAWLTAHRSNSSWLALMLLCKALEEQLRMLLTQLCIGGSWWQQLLHIQHCRSGRAQLLELMDVFLHSIALCSALDTFGSTACSSGRGAVLHLAAASCCRQLPAQARRGAACS